MVKNLFIRKAVEPDDMKGKFYQIFKEPIISELYKLLTENEKEGKVLNSFCETVLTLMAKPDQEQQKH